MNKPGFGPPPARFRIIVRDNFHYADPDEQYEVEGVDTLEVALAKCREIVDQSLAEVAEPGMDAAAIYGRYTMFGEDPFIITHDVDGIPFSGWDYARERAADFVQPQPTDGESLRPG